MLTTIKPSFMGIIDSPTDLFECAYNFNQIMYFKRDSDFNWRLKPFNTLGEMYFIYSNN